MNFEPNSFNNYVGQENIKNSIKISLQASRMRKEPFPHLLIHGASGLGKTTLANLIAKEFKKKCITLLAPVVDSNETLYEALRKCKNHDFLFIDEIHALPRILQESLYTAMTDRKLTAKDKYGSYEIKVNKFTLMGATTELGELSVPFRERFGFIIPLDKYSVEELKQIIKMNSDKLKYKITPEALTDIANACRSNPRSANRLLERCRDVATVLKTKTIDRNIVDETRKNLQIDRNGLTTYDIRILENLAYKFQMKPVGLKTLALSTYIDIKAIENNYEPLLIELGFIDRTSRGRQITREGVLYLAKRNTKNN